ncbi:MAG: phosphoglycerate dehydrogenase [Vicinamibacterales bacterium]
MFEILTLNAISPRGLARLPQDRYRVSPEVDRPDAIIVRSADLHARAIPASVLAIGRAGAGTNNIPVEEMTRRGVPVFNAPGANANAVKELVLAGLFLSSRHLCEAWQYVRGLDAADPGLEKAVEQGKKTFVGTELVGRTLGVVGLGAIGVEVATAAVALGMRVVGFDPQITVRRAWQLSSAVEPAASLDEVFGLADAVTLHVPLAPGTRGLVSAERLARMRPGGTLLNFARGPVADEAAVLAALDAGTLAAYVTDFPTAAAKDHPKVIALPHLGASTHEAEENCAVMVADTVRDFLEHGRVRHSVNFPDVMLPRTPGTHRLLVANANVPNMVGQISSRLGGAGVNIADLLNSSRGDVACTLIDTDAPLPEGTVEAIRAIDGVLAARVVGAAGSDDTATPS